MAQGSLLTPAAEALAIRAVTRADAPALAELLNAIIAAGGTTALEEHFTSETLDHAYLTGPDVHCCFVAVDAEAGRIEGFQTLVRKPGLPDDIGDIATFARIESKQRGVGTALFAATCAQARHIGLVAINATIRADNVGGLRFYGKQGFVDHAIRPAIPLKDGTPVDRIQKRYSLTPTKD